MGGRRLMLHERLWLDRADLPALAWARACAALSVVVSFFRWAWLRLRGKTAYRFSPAYDWKHEPDGTLIQANGLHLPCGWKASEEIDWDAAIREELAKHGKDAWE